MTLLQFFTTAVISAIVLLFIRIFWKQIVFIGTILYILGNLIFWSFLVAVLWAAFVSQTSQGWPHLTSFTAYILILYLKNIVANFCSDRMPFYQNCIENGQKIVLRFFSRFFGNFIVAL